MSFGTNNWSAFCREGVVRSLLHHCSSDTCAWHVPLMHNAARRPKISASPSGWTLRITIAQIRWYFRCGGRALETATIPPEIALGPVIGRDQLKVGAANL